MWSQGKDHALYLWVHLKPTANVREVARVTARLQKLVDKVVDPTMKDEDDEVLAGVGFGPNFYAQVQAGIFQYGLQGFSYFLTCNKHCHTPTSLVQEVDCSMNRIMNVVKCISRIS